MKLVKLLFAGLVTCFTAGAQTDIQKRKLAAVATSFMQLYNTGDSSKYCKFLDSVMKNKAEAAELLKRYNFTYNIIGKVDVRKIEFVSAQQADVWAKDQQFDSWWKFSLLTDSLQHFQKRLVKPERFDAAFLKQNVVTAEQVGSEIDTYITKKLGKNFSGNVFIQHKNKVVFSKSYGNNNEGKPNTYGQDFGLASMGKMFTAISVLQLQEKGLLSLDDTVGKFLPQLKNAPIRKITLKQLLTHTSGMGDFFESAVYNKIKDSIKKPIDMLPVIEDDKLAFEPGKGWQYSNSGFSLLGIIIEKIAGVSFREYVHENIFATAHMLHSLPGDGAGGGRSTINDLSAFAKALQEYRLLKKSTTDNLLHFTVSHQYGMGTEHYLLGKEHIVGHSGGFINECTELNMYTHNHYTIIILSNSNPPFAHFISDKIKELVVSKS